MADESKQEDQEKPAVDEASGQQEGMDPVRKWTLITAAIIVLLMVWYLFADRHTPFTSQARVNAYVVPIAPEVSGTIKEVDVTNNQLVEKGERLFQIDRSRYQLAVDKARADVEAAEQQVGALTAGVESAAANLAAAEAGFVRARKDADRMEQIRRQDPGALSQRRLESAQATLAESRSKVEGAKAELKRAKEQLGESAERNAQLLAARSSLAQAQLDLRRTSLLAPERGLVTDVQVDSGNFAKSGQALMTFIAIHDVWIEAHLTENNLGNVKVGDEVAFVLDVQPGRVFRGTVRNLGYGVASDNNTLGQLPTVENDRNWLREAQRFPVIIQLDDAERKELLGLRVGGQVDVIIYTSDSWILNALGSLYIRLVSLFSYAY